jgi:hypothetical protein
MKRSFLPRSLLIFFVLLPLSLLLVSCLGSQNAQNNFYNAGNSDLNITGAQVVQYWLFRFDTTTSTHNLSFPNAAVIVSNLSSPIVGETIKSSASTVAGNTTLTIYCELDSVNSGSEAVTIY